MYALTATIEPGNASFEAPVSGLPVVRELTAFEIDFVSGGLTSREAAQISALLGTGAALTGISALGAASLGPLGAPAALAGGAISGVLGLASAGFGLYAAFA